MSKFLRKYLFNPNVNFFRGMSMQSMADDDAGGGGGGGDEGGGGGDEGGGGGDENEFLNMLPEDIREDPSLVTFDSVDALGRSYLNLRRMLGEDKVVVPKDPNDQDAWNELYTRIGRPEAAEGYQIQVPEEAVPAELKEMFQEDLQWFKETAHSMGMTQNQANKFYTEYLQRNTGMIETTNAQKMADTTAVQESLRTKFGDAYNVKMTLANRAIMALGGEELSKTLNSLGMGRAQNVIEAFIKVGEMTAEEQGIDRNTGDPALTPDDMDDKISQLQADPAYLDADHPKHNFVVNEVTKIMKQRYPSEEKRTF